MEILEEKKNKNKPYKPVLEDIPDWPVYKLSKNRKEFIDDVAQQSIQRIKALRPQSKQLIDDLEATVYREQNRLKRNRWRVDPKDDPRFWSDVKNELSALTNKSQEEVDRAVDSILEKITHRYASEIAGNFKQTSYKFARSVLKFGFLRLLNGVR
ncbi:MAG: glycerol-3-phosphate acyltransferase, partial [Cytophagales bacterium]|nr:glycerol-3-phosphate acyltransferase [Cytophagales bacterium]